MLSITTFETQLFRSLFGMVSIGLHLVYNIPRKENFRTILEIKLKNNISPNLPRSHPSLTICSQPQISISMKSLH